MLLMLTQIVFIIVIAKNITVITYSCLSRKDTTMVKVYNPNLHDAESVTTSFSILTYIICPFPYPSLKNWISSKNKYRTCKEIITGIDNTVYSA